MNRTSAGRTSSTSRNRRAAGTACAAALSASLLALVPATPAAAVVPCDDALLTTWTGTALDGSWTNPDNWTAGAPTELSNVVVDTAGAVVTGATGSVCDLTLTGGTGEGTEVSLTGDLAVTDDAALTGRVVLGGGSSLTVAELFQLGADAAVSAATGEGVEPVQLVVDGTLKPTGTTATVTGIGVEVRGTTVDGAFVPARVDVNGAALTVTGAVTKQLAAGAVVQDTKPGGTGALTLDGGGTVAMGGTLTVSQPATLRIKGNSTVLDAADGGTTVGGTGSFNWVGGTLSGDLTLSAPTLMDSGGVRHVPAASTVTNLNLLRVADNVLQLDGTLVNKKNLRFVPGVTVLRADGAPGVLRNETTGTSDALAVGAQDTTSGSGLVRLVRISLQNTGRVSVVGGAKLSLEGDAPGPSTQPTVSRLFSGSVVVDPFTPSEGANISAGALVVGRGASLGVSGTVKLLGRGSILLDDTSGGAGTTGTAARLFAARQPARLTGTDAKASFQWSSGTVVGPLLIEKIATTVSNNASKRLLTTTDTSLTALTLAGPTAINATKVTLDRYAKVLVTGTTTIASAPSGFDRTSSSVVGQRVTVAHGGTLKKTSQAPSSFSTGAGTIDVPVTNSGTVTLETSLVLSAGYTQKLQEGVAKTAPTPLLGLISSTTATGSQLVTLSTGTGAGPYAPMVIAAGGLGGVGRVATPDLRVSNAWVHPGFNATAGTMTVQGNLTLGKGADVQIVLRGTEAAKRDKLVVEPLTHTPQGGQTTTIAPGKATLGGRITTMQVGYSPAYGTKVTGVVTFPSRSGEFADAAWSGTPVGTGWRPSYTATTVDVQLKDTAAPSLGLAGIPAFSQLPSQRVTYAAVDNKSGVKSYDVRWRSGSPSRGFSSWVYPAEWQGTTSTAVTKELSPGWTYCFAVRVRDRQGNTSLWSQSLCTSRMLDDPAVSASAAWSRFSQQNGFYGGTFTRTTSQGAQLSTSGTHTRVAVTAYTCPTCGAVEIWSGSTKLKTWDLKADSARLDTWVSPTLTSRNDTVRVQVVSTTGKVVAVDAVGLRR